MTWAHRASGNITRPVRVYRVRLATTESTPKSLPLEGASVLALPDKPSIAVLPFQNMSGDPEQEYFCRWMVEEIMSIRPPSCTQKSSSLFNGFRG